MKKALNEKMLPIFMTTFLNDAKRLVTEINGRLRSSHQLIDRTQTGPFEPNRLEEYYSQFGYRFIQNLHYEIDRQYSLQAIQDVFDQNQSLSFAVPTLRVLATYLVLAKFGIGSDGGMAAQGWVETIEKVDSVFIETTTCPRGNKEFYSHAFVILEVPETELIPMIKKGELIEDLFKRLNKGILFDPALKYACPVSQYQKSPIIPFNELWKTHYVSGLCMGKLTHSFNTFMKKVDSIYREAKKNLDSYRSFKNVIRGISPFLKKKYKEDLAPRVLSGLEALYPTLEWRQNVSDFKFSTLAQGSKEELERIVEELKTGDIEVSGENGLITVTENNPEKIEEFVQIVNEPIPNTNYIKTVFSACKFIARLAFFSAILALILPKSGIND